MKIAEMLGSKDQIFFVDGFPTGAFHRSQCFILKVMVCMSSLCMCCTQNN